MKRRELNDLLISWVTISLAFSWVLGRFNVRGFLATQTLDFWNIVLVLPAALIAVGTAFIFHELAHRYVAKRFGCHAEYRMWVSTLVLALAFALFFGVVFAAPGAVYIYGTSITRRQNGIISLSGPLTNAAIALGFFAVYLAYPSGMIGNIAFIATYINLFLAAFNLIPVWQLDGAKVFAWSPLVWLAVFLPVAGALLLVW